MLDDTDLIKNTIKQRTKFDSAFCEVVASMIDGQTIELRLRQAHDRDNKLRSENGEPLLTYDEWLAKMGIKERGRLFRLTREAYRDALQTTKRISEIARPAWFFSKPASASYILLLVGTLVCFGVSLVFPEFFWEFVAPWLELIGLPI